MISVVALMLNCHQSPGIAKWFAESWNVIIFIYISAFTACSAFGLFISEQRIAVGTLLWFSTSVCAWFHPSVCGPCEHDRDNTVARFFVKLGGHVNHGERMNPIDFRGHRSMVKVTMDIYGNNLVNTIATKPFCAS